jgi:hypothetical protein
LGFCGVGSTGIGFGYVIQQWNCWNGLRELNLNFRKSGVQQIASEQNLIDCNRNDQTGNFGCRGGNMAAAFMYIQFQPGIASIASYPYENQNSDDEFQCRYNRETSIGTVKGYGRIKQNDEVTLKNVVAAVGPVAFSFNGSLNSFLFYG